MNFKVTKSTLLEGLQTVQNIVAPRSTLPILSNVLLTAEKGKLWLSTTDLDISVRCGIEAEVTKAGATTLPVRRLSSIVRELPDSSIEFNVSEENVAQLECDSSYFKIIGLAEDEFPPIPTPDGKFSYHIEEGSFRDMLRRTAYAASTDETRYVLNGVLMSFRDGKLTVVATDGRRLALIERELEFPKDAEGDLIMPTKLVTELMHVLGDEGDLRIYARENQIMFEFEDVLVCSKLVEGTYPNYRQVIPAQCEQRVMVERESLLMALRRASLLTTDKSNATKLTFDNNRLIVVTNTPEVGEARETLPIKYTGEEISVAFNPEYMMDPLKNLTSDEVALEITDELSPGVMKSDIPFIYVLMPMRIS